MGNLKHRDAFTVRSIPSGIVAFVFTDVAGSSSRWERAPRAMADAMRSHDDVLRAEIQRYRGYVFKTVGDAFCATFSTVSDAAQACLAIQIALASKDYSAVDGISVRIAIHLGEAYERDGDYFGPTVNRVARLMSIGHGGQILLSSSAAEALRSTLSPNCGSNRSGRIASET